MDEGKAKIEARFEEFSKEFIDGLEREKKLAKDQYVRTSQLRNEDIIK